MHCWQHCSQGQACINKGTPRLQTHMLQLGEKGGGEGGGRSMASGIVQASMWQVGVMHVAGRGEAGLWMWMWMWMCGTE